MARRVSEAAHDGMVRSAARHLRRRFYRNVRADVREYPTPHRIVSRATGAIEVPDLTAEGKGVHVFEVETTDSILDPHTAEQWPLFAAYAAERSGKFWIVVPRGAGSEAKSRLQELDLRARVWEM